MKKMKRKKFKSLRIRLTLWYALILGLVFLTSDIFIYISFKAGLEDTVDHALLAAAQDTETAVTDMAPHQWREVVKRVERGFLVNRLFIQILEFTDLHNREGTPFLSVARSGVISGNVSQVEMWDMMERQRPTVPLFLNINEQKAGNHPMRLLLYPLKIDGNDGGKYYLIQVGTSLKKFRHTLENFLVILLVSAPVLLLLSVLGGYVILSRALEPVRAVVDAANRITTENLSHRIEAVDKQDEIGQLVVTFNSMIVRLERSVHRIKQFSSDVSHDLKTPLTVIRGQIEVALRKKRKSGQYMDILMSIGEETEKLEQMIENHLIMSRIDAEEDAFLFRPLLLDEVLLEVYEKINRLAAKKGVDCTIDTINTVALIGNRILIYRLVMNVLDNAVKYTDPGGSVVIGLHARGDHALLIVRDTGAGIPEKAIPFVFDRFYRVDEARSQVVGGSGLGLSIVKKIADMHDARVEIHSREGEGSTFTIRFVVDEIDPEA